MSFEFKQKLPTPDEIREQYPLPAHLAELKNNATRKSVMSSPAEAINFW